MITILMPMGGAGEGRRPDLAQSAVSKLTEL